MVDINFFEFLNILILFVVVGVVVYLFKLEGLIGLLVLMLFIIGGFVIYIVFFICYKLLFFFFFCIVVLFIILGVEMSIWILVFGMGFFGVM